MGKIKILSIFVFTLLLFGCGNKNVNASDNAIYATNISVNNINNSYYVGDTILFDDINIEITPSNATVKPIITTNNTNLVSISDNKIEFLNVGICNINFAIESSDNKFIHVNKIINILNPPIYANLISFNKESVVINMDEISINTLSISPNDCSFAPNISYTINDIVNYDVDSGTITPIGEGETTVIAKINSSESEFIVSKFNCKVTNFVYANEIDANILNLDNVTLQTGYSGNINANVLPNSYNLGITYYCSNDLITILEDGSFVVGNKTGSGEIVVSVKSKNNVLTKTIYFNVVEVDESLNVSIKFNNETATKFYAGLTYEVYINNLNIDFSNLIFVGCNYQFIENNKFEIVFNNSGLTNLEISYEYELSSQNKTIYYQNNIFVYQPITDINFGLFIDDVELLPTNNTYKLYLFNLDHKTEANINGVYNSAEIVTSIKGLNICEDDLVVSIEGSSISFKDNIITAEAVGEAIINVVSIDPLKFSRNFKVNVSEILVSSINVNSNSVNLYLDDARNTFNLSYSYYPIYAVNNNVDINVSNNNIKFENNVITALNIGSAELTISYGDVSNIILVNVLPVPNKIVVSVDNKIINNNDNINLSKGTNKVISVELYYNNILTSESVEYSIDGTSISITKAENLNAFKISAINNGTSKILFYYNNLTFTINVLVETPNKVLNANFEENNIEVNMFLVKTITPSIIVELEDNTLPTTDEISLLSNDEGLATVENKSIKLINSGKVTINLLVNNNVCDVLTINIINKEVTEISNVSQLSNLENKSYVVTTDLDLTSFNTIESFNGELDFNNHCITGLNVSLFNNLGKLAVVKNIVIKNDITFKISTNHICSIIAINNYGEINNVTIKNSTIKIEDEEVDDIAYLSLISKLNYGKIYNINFIDVVVKEREDINKQTARFSGITFDNYGDIEDVTGNLTILNFCKVSGVSETTSSTIKNVNLKLNITTPSKFLGAGLVYLISNENCINISDINLDITLTGQSNINSFGGIFKLTQSELNLTNVNSNITLNADYSPEKVALFCHTVASSNLVTVTNCFYNDLSTFNATIIGEIEGLQKKA